MFEIDNLLDEGSQISLSLRVCLVGGVEKWEYRKLWEDRKVKGWKIFSFPSCVFGWRDGKVGGWKILLFG